MLNGEQIHSAQLQTPKCPLCFTQLKTEVVIMSTSFEDDSQIFEYQVIHCYPNAPQETIKDDQQEITFLMISPPIYRETHQVTNHHKILSWNVTPLENPLQSLLREMTTHQKVNRLIQTSRTKMTIHRGNRNSPVRMCMGRRDPIYTGTLNQSNNFNRSHVNPVVGLST